jgi:hypothetical protein
MTCLCCLFVTILGPAGSFTCEDHLVAHHPSCFYRTSSLLLRIPDMKLSSGRHSEGIVLPKSVVLSLSHRGINQGGILEVWKGPQCFGQVKSLPSLFQGLHCDSPGQTPLLLFGQGSPSHPNPLCNHCTIPLVPPSVLSCLIFGDGSVRGRWIS